MNEDNKARYDALDAKLKAIIYRKPSEVWMEIMTKLLEGQNFFPTIMQVYKDPFTFIVIGKKGRCYDNKFSVYEIRLSKTEICTGYEGVLKSFRLLKDAVKYQFEVLAEKNK